MNNNVRPAAFDDSIINGDELHKALEKYVKFEVTKAFAGYQKADIEDAIQEAWAQIFTEFRYYAASKGTLTTFFNFSIRRSNSKHKNNLKYWNISDYYASNANIVKRTIGILESKDLNASPEVIAAYSGLPPESVLDALAIINGSRTVCLEQMTEAEQSNESLFSSSAEASYFDNAYKQHAVRDALKKLDMLDNQTGMAIRMRFGINGGAPKSYSDIAAKLGIKPDDAKRIITRGLRILKSDPALIAINDDD